MEVFSEAGECGIRGDTLFVRQCGFDLYRLGNELFNGQDTFEWVHGHKCYLCNVALTPVHIKTLLDSQVGLRMPGHKVDVVIV